MSTHPYTLREAEKLLGVSRAQLVSLIRGGYVPDTRGQRREYRLSFQDIVMLKAARRLLAARISPRRIARSLARLQAEPAPATPIRLSNVGRDVTLDGGPLASIETGQLLLDFAQPAGVTDPARLLAFPRPAALVPDLATEPVDAAGWNRRGSQLEATRPDDACAAYRRAIDADETLASAYVNLAIVLAGQGRLNEAGDVLHRAIDRCDPEPVLHFNLGTVLEDLQRDAAAISQYQQALVLDPGLADAHYNLGRLYERSGRPQLAIRHFGQYRRLAADPS